MYEVTKDSITHKPTDVVTEHLYSKPISFVLLSSLRTCFIIARMKSQKS